MRGPGSGLPSKRGLAYWPGGGDLPLPPSIVFGSTTGKLYSLKAADGTLNEWFGEIGVVNLKTPEVMQTGTNAAYSLLSSPTIYKNLIITGAGTGEGPGGSNGGAGPVHWCRHDRREWVEEPHVAAGGQTRCAGVEDMVAAIAEEGSLPRIARPHLTGPVGSTDAGRRGPAPGRRIAGGAPCA